MNKILDPVISFFSRFNTNYFFGQPADTITFWFLLSIFLLLLVFVIVYGLILGKKAKKLKPYKSYSKTFFWNNLFLLSLGLVHLFARYENLPLLSWRFWMYLLFAVIVAFNGWFFVKRRQQLDDEVEVFTEKSRKDKWLKKGKK